MNAPPVQPPMKSTAQLSFTQLQSFASCPRRWWARYILGEKSPPSVAASFGSAFDEWLSAKLTGRQSAKGSINNLPEDLRQEVANAAEVYLTSPLAWQHADVAQQEIRITPAQWSLLAEEYGSRFTDICLPIIGFIDLSRKATDGIRTEIVDLKTSERCDYRIDWSIQLILYCLAIHAYRADIHLIVKRETKKAGKSYDLYIATIYPTHDQFRWVLDWVGYWADRIDQWYQTQDQRLLLESPGYHCNWCTYKDRCSAQMLAGLPLIKQGVAA